MSVRVFAPAKINLTLEVGRPRADSMHPLQSVVAFADVGDIVEAAPSEGLSLRITGDFADQLSGDSDENLVLKAARVLAREACVEANVALTLEKNLPVASGMGGGSSDAAATLRALNALWSLDLGDERLQDVARELGADVPVCLAGAPAYMTGTGEIWSAMRAPPFAAVLVNPLKPLSTPLVYREFDRMNLGADFALRQAPVWNDRAAAIAHMALRANALSAPAQSLLPEVGDVLDALSKAAGVEYAAMSGSGATCFALVESVAKAELLAETLRASHPDWWIVETELGGA